MADAVESDDGADLDAIRGSVRALCARFPGEYWRAQDRERAYPTAFVQALTEAGFLGCLIPEEYGGGGGGRRHRRPRLLALPRGGADNDRPRLPESKARTVSPPSMLGS